MSIPEKPLRPFEPTIIKKDSLGIYRDILGKDTRLRGPNINGYLTDVMTGKPIGMPNAIGVVQPLFPPQPQCNR